MTTKLILFDIDGTLVLSGGAGGRAMGRAFTDIFELPDELGSISMAGRTDAWIVSQMAARHGKPYNETVLRRFHDRYIQHLSREIHLPAPNKGVLPGVIDVLDALQTQSSVHVALLTGNFEHGARIKLEYFRLWHYFDGGAFGDQAHDRNTLLGAAIQRIAAEGGPLCRPADVTIVGDTPLDVGVAVAGGARSLAVATGGYDEETLRRSGADVVVKDLSDRDRVLQALGLDAGPDAEIRAGRSAG